MDGGDGDGGAEVGRGEGAVLETVGGAGAFVGVGAAEEVAQLVRQIGQDLKEGGGEECRDGECDRGGVAAGGETEPEDDAREGEGEGAQPHRADNGGEFFRHIGLFFGSAKLLKNMV